MKTATVPFINWLGAATEFYMVDLYTLSLTTGEVFRFTDAGSDVIVTVGPLSGITFKTGPPNFLRGSVEETIGLSKIGTLDLEIHANPTDVLGSIAFLQRAARGDLDKATIRLDRLFVDPILGQQGTILKFFGNIGDHDQISRTMAKFTCRAGTDELANSLPRNILQPTCIWTLFDNGCGLNKASFAVNGTVATGTVNTLTTNLTNVDTYFDNGQLTFLTGPNAGHVMAIRTYLHASGQIIFFIPLPTAPLVGDTFVAYPACDKLKTTCVNKFSNLANYRGFDFVPVPETVI